MSAELREGVALAGIGQRVAARIIDGLLFSAPVIAYLVSRPLGPDGEANAVPLWVNLAFLAASSVYEIALVRWRGQTLGKMVLRIRIVRAADGELPSTQQAAIRFLLPTAFSAMPYPILSVVALIIYVSAVWDPERRGYHDKAAGTIVVKAPAT